MGKRYYCEYCDKTMVSTPSVIKTHNKGVVHQKLVNEHYNQFKDAETILEEESHKKPCVKFLRGECPFGSICRYSHYTPEQLNILREHVAAKQYSEAEMQQPSFQDLYQKLQDEKSKIDNVNEKNTILYDSNGFTHVLPWSYNPIVLNGGDSLPPSLRVMKIEDFCNINIVEWG